MVPSNALVKSSTLETSNSESSWLNFVEFLNIPFIVFALDKPITLDLSSAITIEAIFQNASQFNQDISHWDVSNVKNFSEAFGWTGSFRNPNALKDWNLASAENTSFMFLSSDFNGDLSNWNTGNITNMNSMFRQSNFGSDISSWDVGNVIDYDYFSLSSNLQPSQIPNFN